MTKVVTMREGYPVPTPGEPDQSLVTMLEEELTMARSGELCGAVLVRSYADGGAGWRRSGTLRSPYSVIGALEEAKTAMLKDG